LDYFLSVIDVTKIDSSKVDSIVSSVAVYYTLSKQNDPKSPMYGQNLSYDTLSIYLNYLFAMTQNNPGINWADSCYPNIREYITQIRYVALNSNITDSVTLEHDLQVISDNITYSSLNIDQKESLRMICSVARASLCYWFRQSLNSQSLWLPISKSKDWRTWMNGCVNADIDGGIYGALTGGAYGALGGTTLAPGPGTITGAVSGFVVGGATGAVGGSAWHAVKSLFNSN